MRPAADPASASSGASWVAAQLLSNAAWLPDDMQEDLVRWALEAWLVHPPRNSLDALQSVDWIYKAKGRSGKLWSNFTRNPKKG